MLPSLLSSFLRDLNSPGVEKIANLDRAHVILGLQERFLTWFRDHHPPNKGLTYEPLLRDVIYHEILRLKGEPPSTSRSEATRYWHTLNNRLNQANHQGTELMACEVVG